ncbi:unnamed protein product [Pedinophyceae sp. YPF-701]|nr:unnamed protein product [Pedinophyceae sp. YPF-701]
MSAFDRFGTQAYETLDPLTNLRLRVVVRVSQRPLPETFLEPAGDDEGEAEPEAPEQSVVEHEAFLTWQQKLPRQDLTSRHPPGDVRGPIFTYVDTDAFVQEAAVAVHPGTTTGASSHLVQQQARSDTRRYVTRDQSMFVMCDTSTPLVGPEEVALVRIRSHATSLFDLKPGFTRPGDWERTESPSGVVVEFRVEDASTTAGADPPPSKSGPGLKGAALRRNAAVAAAARRRGALGGAFQMVDVPERGTVVAHVLCELQCARGFPESSVYVNWWVLVPRKADGGWAHVEGAGGELEGEVSKVYVSSGSTQVAKATRVAVDALRGSDSKLESRLACPIELELHADHEVPPSKWPTLVFEVNSLDSFGRQRTLGYAHLTVPPEPGCATRTLETWRPVGTLTERLQELFVGGMQAFDTPLSVKAGADAPAGPRAPKVLSRLGLVTEGAGDVVVRVHVITRTAPSRRGVAAAKEVVRDARPAARAARKTRQAARAQEEAALLQGSKTLQEVVERARRRLQAARAASQGGEAAARGPEPGGDLGDKRGRPPRVVGHPRGGVVEVGMAASFEVQATGRAPMEFQWYKDGRKVGGNASAATARLEIESVTRESEGQYLCRVANADGSSMSLPATLAVRPRGTLAHLSPEKVAAAAGERGEGGVRRGRREGPVARLDFDGAAGEAERGAEA